MVVARADVEEPQRRWHDVHVWNPRLYRVALRDVLRRELVGHARRAVDRGGAVSAHVEEQDPEAARREVVGEQHRVGGLSRPAFHAWECDDRNASSGKTRRENPPAQ